MRIRGRLGGRGAGEYLCSQWRGDVCVKELAMLTRSDDGDAMFWQSSGWTTRDAVCVHFVAKCSRHRSISAITRDGALLSPVGSTSAASASSSQLSSRR